MSNNKDVDLLKSIVSDATRFTQYTHQKFSDILELAQERHNSNSYSQEIARRHKSLNRYTDIVPFDHNTIKLKDGRLGSTDDYINASWILPPYDIPRLYIATQGPLQNTVLHFWRLVMEQQVPIIVCLTAQYDNQREKCAKYWPIKDEKLEFNQDQFKVKVWNMENERNDENAECIVRNIKVEFYKDNELVSEHQVTQLHFLGWPDHGVPNQTRAVLGLIDLTREKLVTDKPILVHCSAGCGRTGTFCVIDAGQYLLKNSKQDILMDPVFMLTDSFRKQRTTMVQSEIQYKFCYTAIKDFL